MLSRRWMLPVLFAGVVVQSGCRQATAGYRETAPDPELLHAAVGQMTDVIIYDIFSPPQASRAYAYATTAAYEALRHDHPGYLTLAGQLNGLTTLPVPEPGAEHYLPLASVHAFLSVARALTFSRERVDSVRSAMHDRFRALGVPEPVFERSIAYGDRVVEHILAWAAQDYFAQTRGYPKYSVTTATGRWTPTPPAYMDAVEPNWWRLRPFVLDSASQFQPPAPIPFDTAHGSPFHAQVREVYEVRQRLTDEQREIAAFWDCNPYVMNVRGHAMFATKKITPGGHWMSITRIAARRSGADLMEAAEAYVRTAVALADGFIVSWEAKYRTNVARPETVINSHLDEIWEPLLQTPPFPEYTSGHSVISAAAATVLTEQFGSDFAYDDDTEIPFGIPIRSFRSFEEAATEAAWSRLYGGIHYRMGIEAGIEQGRQVGRHVVARLRTRNDVVASSGPGAGVQTPPPPGRADH